jgi:hypothetical protein
MGRPAICGVTIFRSTAQIYDLIYKAASGKDCAAESLVIRDFDPKTELEHIHCSTLPAEPADTCMYRYVGTKRPYEVQMRQITTMFGAACRNHLPASDSHTQIL